jgi:hypothetical protein
VFLFLEHISKTAFLSIRTIHRIAGLVKLKLSLVFSNNDVIKIMMYMIGNIASDIIAFAIDEVDWSAPRLGRFYLGEFVPNTFWIGRWVGLSLVTLQ